MSFTQGSPGWYILVTGALTLLAALYTISAWATYRNAWKQPLSPQPAVLLRSGLLKTAFMFGVMAGACYLMDRDAGSALFMGACLGLGTAIDAAAEILAHARKRRLPSGPEREAGATP